MPLTGGVTTTTTGGSNFLQGLLNAAGGVADVAGSVLQTLTPEQRQQANQIAMAIVQPQQQRPAPFPAPVSSIRKADAATPVLIADAGTTRNDYGPTPGELAPMPIPEVGPTEGGPPAPPVPPVGPAVYSMPGQAQYGYLPPQQPQYAQPLYTPELAQARAQQARLRQEMVRQYDMGVQQPRMMQPPAYPGYGQPQGWAQRIGNGLDRLRQGIDPRYAQIQNVRNQHEAAAAAAYNKEMRERAQQEYENRLKYMQMMQSGSNVDVQNATNAAMTEYKSQNHDPGLEWTKPAAVEAAIDHVLKFEPGSYERAQQIAYYGAMSGGRLNLKHLMSAKSIQNETAEGQAKSRNLRDAGEQQRQEIRAENKDAIHRKKEADAQIAEAAAGQAKQQQALRTSIMGSQNKLAGLNAQLKQKYGDQEAQTKIAAEQRKVRSELMGQIDDMNKQASDTLKEFDRYNLASINAITPQNKKEAQQSIAKMFGMPLAPKGANIDQQVREIMDKSLPGFSKAEKDQLFPEIKSRAMLIPQRVLEAQLYKQYAYGRQMGDVMSVRSSEPQKKNDSGQVEAGNIDLTKRPVVRNRDGSISTVRSMSFGDGKSEILVPTVSDDGRIMSEKEAIDTYYRTGRHLGKFSTPEAATAYAESLHKDQERMYASRPSQPLKGR